jgi:TolB-like protein/DNA-binding winged helix-turn-helix (wHTH) protein/Tfp pilus assembly protein PilF
MKSTNDTTGTRAAVLYVFGPFRLDAPERRLLEGDREIALTRKAFDLLLALVEHAGHLQTRDELIGSVWWDTVVEEHSLTWYVSVLRKALGDTGEAARYIETVRGHGYRFIAPLERVPIERGGIIGGVAEAAVTHIVKNETAASGDSRIGVIENGQPSYARKTALQYLRPFITVAIGILMVIGAVWWRSERPSSGQAAPVPLHSVAVLPFENFGPDADIAYFVHGIQSTISTKLAGIGDLHVAARTSTDAYPSRPDDYATVARQLGVATLLEGSVQKSGNKALVNVQLIDGHSGKALWAQTYTRALDDVFAIQREIAERVATALEAKMLPAEVAHIASSPTRNAQAYNAFLQAEYISWRMNWTVNHTLEVANEAEGLYREAIKLDDQFALAYAGLSLHNSNVYWLSIDFSAHRIATAEDAAKRALELAPQLPQAHLAMGYVLYYGHRDYGNALAEFELARSGLPNDAGVVGAIAYLQRRQGRWLEAMDGFEKAAAFDPRNPEWPNMIADTLVILRDYKRAEAAYERAQAVDPKNKYAAINLMQMYVLSAQVERLATAMRSTSGNTGPLEVQTSDEFMLAWLRHDPDAALKALATAAEWIDNPWMIGSIPASLLRAEALNFKGDASAARENYLEARISLQAKLRDETDNPRLFALLGLAEAGLGNRRAALQAGVRATEMVSVATDAMDGPHYQVMLAHIHVRLDEPEEALSLIRQMLAIPAGNAISEKLFQLDPRFRTLWTAFGQTQTAH